MSVAKTASLILVFLLFFSSELAEHIKYVLYISCEACLRQILLSSKNVSYRRIQQWYTIFIQFLLKEQV